MIKKLRDFLTDLRFGVHEDTRAIRNLAIVVGLATVLIVAGLSFVIKGYPAMQRARTPTTYSKLQSSPAKGIEQLKSAMDEKRDVTLVLHRTGCDACENAQPTIARAFYQDKKQNWKHLYVMFDVAHLTHEQFQYLENNVPGVMVQANHIPTPLVANLKAANGVWKVKSQSNTDSRQHILATFSKAAKD